MGDLALRTVIRRLHHRAGAEPGARLGDAELLRRLLKEKDEAAFEVIVWRHGPMVLGLCQRMLRHAQDAEDAFQATFLALLRAAHTIGKHSSLSSWLYKVAYRIALKLKSQAARRPQPIREQSDLTAGTTTSPVDANDLRTILDEEIQQLPPKHRSAVIQCYLQGKTCDQAAQELGCPRGTVVTHLARARKRLRVRLAKRGFGPTAGILALISGSRTSAAHVPYNLAQSTITGGVQMMNARSLATLIHPAVLAQMQGATRTLIVFHRLRATLLAVLYVGMLTASAGPLAWAALASEQAQSSAQQIPAASGKQSEKSKGKAQNRPDDWVGYNCREMVTGPELIVLLENGELKTFQATADAVLLAYAPDFACGQMPVSLSIDLRDQNRMLLKFDSMGGRSVRKAELVLTRAENLQKLPPRPFEISIHEVTQAWDEAKVTWKNQPKFEPRLAATALVNANSKELRIDVTDLARRAGEPGSPDQGWMFKVARPLLEKPVHLNAQVVPFEYPRLAVEFAQQQEKGKDALPPFRRPAAAPGNPRWVGYLPRETQAGPELVIQWEEGPRKSYPATADAVVIAYLAGAAYGSLETWLSVDLADTNRLLLRFDVPDSGKIRKAELVMHAVRPPAGSPRIPVPDQAFVVGIHEVRELWREDSVTWLNQPEFSEKPSLMVSVDPRAKVLKLDVTPLAQRLTQKGVPNHGWLLRTAEPTRE